MYHDNIEESKFIYTKLEDIINPKKMTREQLEDFPICSSTIQKNIKEENKDIKSQKDIINIAERKFEKCFINAYKQSKFSEDLKAKVIRGIENNSKLKGLDLDQENKANKNQNFSNDLIISDKNFLSLVNEKIANIKSDKGIETSTDIKKTNSEGITVNNVKTNRKKEKINSRFKKLKNAIYFILSNDLAEFSGNDVKIREVFDNPHNANFFQKRPYEYPNSIQFFEAVKFDKPKIVEKMLKESLAYCFSYDFFNQTPYHWAAKRNNEQILKILLKSKRACNQIDINGRTPLFLAAENDCYETCQLLLWNGADTLIKDNEGRTPLSVAKKGSKVFNLINSHIPKNFFSDAIEGKEGFKRLIEYFKKVNPFNIPQV